MDSPPPPRLISSLMLILDVQQWAETHELPTGSGFLAALRTGKLLPPTQLIAWWLSCNLDLDMLGNSNYWLASVSLISEVFMICLFNQPCPWHELPVNIFMVLPPVMAAWGFHALKERRVKGDLWHELLKGSSAPQNFWGSMWKGYQLFTSFFRLTNLWNTCC